ncbi:MAG: histidine kinase [Burkholderiales bacterium]
MNLPRGSAAAPLPFRPLRTLRFALVVAAGFLLLTFALSAKHPSWHSAEGWARAAGNCLVFSLLISFTIDGLYAAGRRLIGARFQVLQPWQRWLYYWGTPLLGIAIALPVAMLTVDPGAASNSGPELRTTPLGAMAFMLLVMAIFYGYFAIRARQLRAEQQATEAQLRLLQAQMEPHFLFNTLANVVGLMDADPPRAKLMLESFTDYLRASLGSLRAGEQTLGAELALVESYLHIAKIRMDDRLQCHIDVPEALRAHALPSLSLQPLVENAIQHGLEPQIAGGSVRVAAQLEGETLVLTVSDDGLGLSAARSATRRGSGTALANIRARLQQRFGDRARLTIEAQTPHGVRATLRLPAV